MNVYVLPQNCLLPFVYFIRAFSVLDSSSLNFDFFFVKPIDHLLIICFVNFFNCSWNSFIVVLMFSLKNVDIKFVNRFAFRGNRSNHTVVSVRRKFSCLEKSILFLSPFASCVLLIFFVQDINVKQVLQVRGEMCLQRASALVTQRRRPVCCLVPPPFVYLFIIQWDLQPAFVRQNMFKQCLYVPFIRVYCQI